MSRKRARTEPYLLQGIALTDVTTDGRGVGRTPEGKVLFVTGALPGDVADVLVYNDRRAFAEARIEALLQPSADRQAPACRHFGSCGGCQWQHQQYSAQLRYKKKQVRDAFERIAGIAEPPLRPILGAPAEYHYRNKLEFSFAPQRWLDHSALQGSPEQVAAARLQPALGYHAPGAYDKVLHIEQCLLMPEQVNALRNRVHTLAQALGLSYHHPKTHEGLLRSLLVRHAEATNQWLVLLSLYEANVEVVSRLYTELAKEFEWVSTWAWVHNPKLNDSIADLPIHIWKGEQWIEEQLHDKRFQLSASAFFQTNTQQAARLYQVAFDLIQERHAEPVSCLYDLYCGAGSIGICGAHLADSIIGVEYNAESVANAKVNAQLNDLSHLQFVAGDMAKVLDSNFAQRYGQPQVVITDPPRGGMDKAVVKRLLEIRPETIVYISCNVATQARDVSLLNDNYSICVVQPVDMFPQTSHIESVALLARKD